MGQREKNERDRERDRKRVAAGLCVDCGKPAEGQSRCTLCAERENARRREWRYYNPLAASVMYANDQLTKVIR